MKTLPKTRPFYQNVYRVHPLFPIYVRCIYLNRADLSQLYRQAWNGFVEYQIRHIQTELELLRFHTAVVDIRLLNCVAELTYVLRNLKVNRVNRHVASLVSLCIALGGFTNTRPLNFEDFLDYWLFKEEVFEKADNYEEYLLHLKLCSWVAQKYLTWADSSIMKKMAKCLSFFG